MHQLRIDALWRRSRNAGAHPQHCDEGPIRSDYPRQQPTATPVLQPFVGHLVSADSAIPGRSAYLADDGLRIDPDLTILPARKASADHPIARRIFAQLRGR